jgi:FGGY-family pentulose kinase
VVKVKGIVSIDLGTQSARVALYDLKGRLLALAVKSYKTWYPVPGAAEQDPKEWWSAIRSGVVEVTSKYPECSVIGITASATSSTVLPVDSAGNPLARAILWMDTRATKQAEKINRIASPVLRWCGGSVSPEWFLPKLLWIKEKQPELYSEAYLIVEALDWLNYMLTGKWVASQCNASCKWNYIPGEGWPVDFVEAVGLPDLLCKIPSEVLPVGTPIGVLRKEIAADLRCKEGIPVVQGGVDAHLSLVGTGSFREGDVSLVIGSSSVLLMNTTICEPIPGFLGPYKGPLYKGVNLLEGGQISSGAIIRWFVEGVAKHYAIEADRKGLSPFDLLDAEASEVAPGAEGIVVLDHWQGNRTPYKDPASRGLIWGLTLYHGAPQVGRALYEGISFGVRLLFDRLGEGGIQVRDIKVCGGGTKSRLWTQILADVIERPLKVTSENMTLLGNAIVAATGIGVFSSFEEGFLAMKPTFEEVSPIVPFSAYRDSYEKYQKLYRLAKDLVC